MTKYITKTIGFFINLISLFSPSFAAHISIILFSSPQKGKSRAQETSYLKEAKQKDVICNDIKIKTYHWQGNKDSVLLAHGWESNSYRWKDLIDILTDLDYDIVALDAPAHGNSGGKLFNALIYSECISKVAKEFSVSTIIGHSVGGMATAFSIYNNPQESINKIILLGAPSNFKGVFSRYVSLMGYNKRVANAMNQYTLKHFNHLPEYFSASDFSKNFKAKGLIIHDKKDRIIPYQDALDFKKHYQNSEFISTEGLGHGLKSDSIYKHIIDFLKS